MKIYVASSWRNNIQPEVVDILRRHGHEVYDFKKPMNEPDGFHWSDIDPNWRNWTEGEYLAALHTDFADHGFRRDHDAMEWAEACVLVLPCGRSAHLEAGEFIGKGKRLYILLDDTFEAELMYKGATMVTGNLIDIIDDLAGGE